MSESINKRKLIHWLVVNLSVITLAVLALFYAHVWASNLLKFYLWFSVIISAISAFSEDTRAHHQKNGKPCPDWLAASYDIIFVCLLVAHGWFLYGALATFQAFCYIAIFHIENKPKVIDVLLFCPMCDTQHVDAPKGDWTNPPHRSHLCNFCGHVWRPCDEFTNGVEAIKTKGKNDKTAYPAERFEEVKI